MTKQVTLVIETSGKNLDAASEQSVLDAVEKALQAITLTVSVRVQQAPAPAPAPAAPAPVKAA